MDATEEGTRPRRVARTVVPAWFQGGTQGGTGAGDAVAGDELVARTAGRDRYADALRVGSLLVVVLGHWLMGGVDADGHVTNALVDVGWLQPASWLLQVMPLFFLVGGLAHAYTWDSLVRRGGTSRGRYAGFVRVRTARLLRPTAALVGCWVVLGLIAHATAVLRGPSAGLVATALLVVTQLLWFVGVYMGVVALAPLMYRAHRRLGGWVVVLLAGAAAAADVVRFAGGITVAGTLNFAFVWLALHQLGFCWRDGLLSLRAAARLAAGGAVALLALVTWGPYPVSMVGLPGAAVSNMAPPTLALLAQGLALVGLAVVVRAPATRLLERPGVWRRVVLAGSVTMTVFLWHLTALFCAVLGLRLLGVEQPAAGSAAWWATRPVWIAVLALLTVPLVVAAHRFDVPRRSRSGLPAEVRRWPDAVAAVGAAVTVLGVLMVSVTGVDVLSGQAIRFVAVDVTPAAALAVTSAGWFLVAAARPRRASPDVQEVTSLLASRAHASAEKTAT